MNHSVSQDAEARTPNSIVPALPELSDRLVLDTRLPKDRRGNPNGPGGSQQTARYARRLRSLVPMEVAREDRELVWRRTFSPQVRRWIAMYNRVGLRDLYLWQWCSHGIELTTLPGVSDALRGDACDFKLLSIILCVLIDDVADRQSDRRWLTVLLDSLSEGSSPATIPEEVPREHVEVTRQLWQAYVENVSRLPRFAEYAEAWRFDLQQFLNSLRYGFLVNRQPALMNWTEHNMYTPHNMLITSFATVDVMCHAEFDVLEIGRLRRAIWHAQAMGRIGNVLSTWRRELREGDYSAGVFAAAVNQGILSPDDLQSLDDRSLERRIEEGGFEVALMKRWWRHRSRFATALQRIQSVDLSSLVSAHDRFLQMYLSSSGLL